MKQRLYQRWENYSPWEKRGLMLLAVLSVITIIWLGIFSPLMDYQQKGKEKMNKTAEDYLWMADNVSHLDFIRPQKKEEPHQSLVQLVTQTLKEYTSLLTINVINDRQLTLHSDNQPVDFLTLMRFLVYLQAAHDIQIEKIDLIADRDNSNLVLVNELLLSREAESEMRKQAN